MTEVAIRHQKINIKKIKDLMAVCLGLQDRYQHEQDILSAPVVLNMDEGDCSAKINKWRKKVLAWDEAWGKNQNAINKIQERPRTRWYQRNREHLMARQLEHKRALMEDHQRLLSEIEEILREHGRDLA